VPKEEGGLTPFEEDDIKIHLEFSEDPQLENYDKEFLRKLIGLSKITPGLMDIDPGKRKALCHFSKLYVKKAQSELKELGEPELNEEQENCAASGLIDGFVHGYIAGKVIGESLI